MKKIVLALVLLSVLAGCGEKTYNKNEKRDLVLKVYGWSRKPQEGEAKEKLDKIIGDLEKKAAKGDKKAEAELQEWKNLLPVQQIHKKANTRDGKWE
ncbi:hypothetical protein [Fusobacterium varium]|uniref:hypothetical protein n=1 Tax=Fusobacterium varium TaxID=856 RepID=UPI001F46E4B4|nr:hypothetical protein [Fusobacterium varium]MCF2673624.1 hypothetical protein [Fusobacterium varium]